MELLYFAEEESTKKQIEYRGRKLTPNKPVPSNRENKKFMVLVDSKGRKKLVHFGAKGYGNNTSPQARKNYLKRSAGIRNKQGRLTKDDKFSPNYWSRRYLWSKKSKPVGSSKFDPED